MPGAANSYQLLVAMPFVTGSFLLLILPGAASSYWFLVAMAFGFYCYY